MQITSINNKTFFSNDPVVISISGFDWSDSTSPIKMVRLQVLDGENNNVAEFCADAGNNDSMEFDISTALRAMWSEYAFSSEIVCANAALPAQNVQVYLRTAKSFGIKAFTEYIDTDGTLDTSTPILLSGGSCILGGRTEWERFNTTNADVSDLEHSNLRNGDASTKPVSSPERVGKESITSWVDVSEDGTKSIFYPSSVSGEEDDPGSRQSPYTGHAPLVLRDTIPYIDFLFVNRRGAVETCSGLMKEAMEISVDAKQHALTGAPAFKPERTIMSVATGGRRSWSMSSGYQTREWAEWWALEFLMARRHWMLYKGKYVPVTVTPSKKATSIYDRTKQQMPSVEFTVTLALEG